MRAVGLGFLLAGSLLLLWPQYSHLFRSISIGGDDAKFYGGMLLLAGILALLFSRFRTS